MIKVNETGFNKNKTEKIKIKQYLNKKQSFAILESAHPLSTPGPHFGISHSFFKNFASTIIIKIKVIFSLNLRRFLCIITKCSEFYAPQP